MGQIALPTGCSVTVFFFVPSYCLVFDVNLGRLIVLNLTNTKWRWHLFSATRQNWSDVQHRHCGYQCAGEQHPSQWWEISCGPIHQEWWQCYITGGQLVHQWTLPNRYYVHVRHVNPMSLLFKQPVYNCKFDIYIIIYNAHRKTKLSKTKQPIGTCHYKQFIISKLTGQLLLNP